MSAVADTRPGAGGLGPAHPASPAGTRVTLRRVVRSEWTKLWSLRSTRWSLACAFVFQAGLGPLIAEIQMARWSTLSLQDRLTINPIDHALGGWHLAQLAIGVLGVLMITGEYSTGQIRSSFMAVPRRLPVLWAKLLVFSAVTFVLILVSAVIGFYGAMAIYTQHHVNVALSAPGALRALIGSVLFLTVTGMLCTGMGTIIRATAGGISGFVVLMFVLPGIAAILPTSMSNAVHPYLPSVAGGQVGMALQDSHAFSPWGGFALFCGYTIVVIVAAAYLLRSRDA